MSKFFKGTKTEEVVETVEPTVEVTEVVEEEVVVKETKVITHDTMQGKAFSVQRNPDDGLFYLVKITFDISSGKVGTMEFVGTPAPERFVMVERFKIEVARAGLV